MTNRVGHVYFSCHIQFYGLAIENFLADGRLAFFLIGVFEYSR